MKKEQSKKIYNDIKSVRKTIGIMKNEYEHELRQEDNPLSDKVLKTLNNLQYSLGMSVHAITEFWDWKELQKED